ncbi:GTPase [Aerosakkonema funiforme]|uniref:GTPase n=1 Tax=Aerosakkonema funiforme TaxID=1246630 RepID=UPI0035B9ECD8
MEGYREFERRIEKELRESIENLKVPNIAVIGMSGSGKSTLINCVFGSNQAKTGAGSPITEGFKRYSSRSEGKPPVVLYDSAGYEPNKEAQFVSNVVEFLERSHRYQIEHKIHLVWYVINAATGRFLEFDAEIINKISSLSIPLIIVISKCDIAQDADIEKIEEVIRSYKFKRVYNIIRLAAQPMVKGEKPICQPFGLEEIVKTTLSELPDIYELAVIASQKIIIKSKRKVAWNYIQVAALACFGAAFIPLPGTTAATTGASQYSLLKVLMELYGYEDFIDPLLTVSGTTLQGVLTLIATFVLDSIALVFPPAFFATETISGLAGSAYVIVVGLSVTTVLERLAQSRLTGNESQVQINILKEDIRKEIGRYSHLNITSKQDIENVGQDFIKGKI